MDILSSKKLKVFLTAFLIFSLFIRWPGMNENSRFFLTQSVVNQDNLNIDENYNSTCDRSLFHGHYYSDKAPGLSFLATPAYLFSQFLSSFIPQPCNHTKKYVNSLTVNGEKIYQLKNPTISFRMGVILVVMFTSCIFGALSCVLIYLLSSFFLEKEVYRLLVTFAFGFGTLIFHQSTVFLPHAAATFFALLSFYLIYKFKMDELDVKYLFISGLIMGIGVLVQTKILLVALPLFLYLLSFEKRRSYLFLLGALLGVLPFFIYNYTIFHNPLQLPRSQIDPKIFPNLQNNIGLNFGVENIFIFMRLLFYPYRGIFFYYPFLLISLFGLYKGYQKHKKEALLFLSIFLTVTAFTSMWWAWWHGGSWGARHLTITMPFLVLPICWVIKKVDRRILILLLAVSIFTNLVGFQAHYEDMLKDLDNSSKMKPKYQKKVVSVQPLANPIYEYYLPKFLEHGPRSRIISSVYWGKFPDIRDFKQMKETPSFLIFISIFLAFVLIWREELLDYLR